MIIKTIKVGYLRTNCYVLINGDDAIIVDPGDDYDRINSELNGLNVRAILITHHHFDHVGALDRFGNVLVIDFYSEKRKYQIGEFYFELIDTKGHTDDCVTFYFRNDNIMFTGDFLFKGTVGRTDLDTSSFSDMMKSIKVIKEYPMETVIYPGHGYSTVLGDEVESNIYFS